MLINKIKILTIAFFLFFAFPALADNLYYTDTNGTASYSLSGTSQLTAPKFTYMFWYRLLNSADQDTMGGMNYTAGNRHWQLYFERFGISTDGTNYSYWYPPLLGAKMIALNEWHHYAYTFDGTTTKAYLDGALASTTLSLSGKTVYTGGTSYFFLNNNGSGSYVSDSNWDDVKYYSRVLTDGEVADEYNCVIQTPYDDALELYIDFDAQNGNDLSSNNYDLTAVNSPAYANTTLPFTEICAEEVPPTATTTSDLFPCEVPENTLIQRITGCKNIYGTLSTSSPEQVEYFYFDIPMALLIFVYLLIGLGLSIVFIFIFINKKK